MKRFSRNLTIICINVLIFILAGCADLYQTNWMIKAENQTKTVGRVGYIELKLTNQNGLPVSNAQINLMYKENGQWKTFKDALTGEETFVTDMNGVVRVTVFSLKEAAWQFLAYLADDPSIKTQFTVRFKRPQWLFMIWMCADNNKNNNANNNTSTFLIFDGGVRQDCFLVMDELGEWITIGVFQQDLDSGDSSLLLECLKILFGSCEANNYSLILWDHGSAWVNDSAYKKEITSRAIAFDDTSKHAISTADLRKALEDFSTQTGKRINLLGMDACLMGSIEVLYELRDIVDYVVASSFTVPGDGYDYVFFKQIVSTDGAVGLGRKIVDTFKDYYDTSSYWKQKGLSLAVYDMSKVESTAFWVDSLAKRLVEMMDNDLRNTVGNFYPSLAKYNNNNDDNLLVDLNDFAHYTQSIGDRDVQDYAQKIQNVLAELIVYEYVEKTNYEIQNPVSIFMPNKKDVMLKYRADYETLSFFQIRWFNFLESWLE